MALSETTASVDDMPSDAARHPMPTVAARFEREVLRHHPEPWAEALLVIGYHADPTMDGDDPDRRGFRVFMRAFLRHSAADWEPTEARPLVDTDALTYVLGLPRTAEMGGDPNLFHVSVLRGPGGRVRVGYRRTHNPALTAHHDGLFEAMGDPGFLAALGVEMLSQGPGDQITAPPLPTD